MKKLIILVSIIILPCTIFSQSIVLEKCISEGNFPEIYWFTTSSLDSADFQVFRKGAEDGDFSEIYTLHWADTSRLGDTTAFVVIDTTITNKGLFHYYIVGGVGGGEIVSNVGNGHSFGWLPKPQLNSFKGTPTKDRKAINLEWDFNYHKTINYISIYRSSDYDTGYEKIVELDNEETSYIDHVPMANEPWFYYMIIHDYYGDQLPSVRIPAFATYKEKSMSPFNLTDRISNDSVYIDWENVGTNIIGYRVYRSIDKSPFYLMGEMVYNIESTSRFVDADPLIKDAIHLEYYVLNVSDGFLESIPSDTVNYYRVENEKVLPPKTLDRIINSDRTVKLLWEPPDEGMTLGYNVYITDPDGSKNKLNEKLLTVNHFSDTIFRSAGKYIYSVEGVGYENRLSDLLASTVVIKYPFKSNVILVLTRVDEGIKISWSHPNEKHLNKIILYKKPDANEKSVVLGEFSSIEDIEYIDKEVENRQLYQYFLEGVLIDGSKITLNKGVDMYL